MRCSREEQGKSSGKGRFGLSKAANSCHSWERNFGEVWSVAQAMDSSSKGLSTEFATGKEKWRGDGCLASLGLTGWTTAVLMVIIQMCGTEWFLSRGNESTGRGGTSIVGGLGTKSSSKPLPGASLLFLPLAFPPLLPGGQLVILNSTLQGRESWIWLIWWIW